MLKEIGQREPVTIGPYATIYQASRLMTEHNIGALIVTGADSSLKGVISERDIVQQVNAKNLNQFTTRVDDIMTQEVVRVSPLTNHDECKALMDQYKIRHLPVVEGGKIVGMISMKDIIASDAYDEKLRADHMEKYIKGG